MYDIILAGCKGENNNPNVFGIGIAQRLPWKNAEELQIFKEKTINSVLITGRKTAQNLPFLDNNRFIVVVSRNKNLKTSTWKNKVEVEESFIEALNKYRSRFPDRQIFLIGGGEIIKSALSTCRKQLNKIHISFMNGIYFCDTFVELPLNECIIESVDERKDFTHYVYNSEKSEEQQYLNLLSDILINGTERETRSGDTKALFCKHLSFNLQTGFPLLTTKKMFWRGIVEELLFFIRGDTNSKILENKKINIWQKNTSREFLEANSFTERNEGLMGPLYGWQWRSFNEDYDDKGDGKIKKSGFDQLTHLIQNIKNDPHSRRHLLTTYNPLQGTQGVLYPCHSIVIQFYVEYGFLDAFVYNRSCDVFLGLPFNIASSALLIHIVAKLTELQPRYMHLSLGDTHIYTEHTKVVKEQLERVCYKFPMLEIPDFNNLEEVENSKSSDYKVHNYFCHSSLKAEMKS